MKAAAARMAASMDGLPVESVALMLALGFVLGTFPVWGCPTVLCALAAARFRLNLPALQLVNQLTSPVQIALWAPLAWTGSRLLGPAVRPAAIFPPGVLALQAIAGWCVVCVPVGIVLHFTLLHALRRWKGFRPSASEFHIRPSCA